MPPDAGAATDPLPRREMLTTVAEQVAAIDTLLGIAKHSLRVFDVDLSGTETRHPEVRAVPNPPHPAVKLLSPAYGATLSPGEIPAFDWTPETRRGQRLVISTDPTFADPSKAVRAAGTRALESIRAELLPLDAPLYWRVEQPGGRGG